MSLRSFLHWRCSPPSSSSHRTSTQSSWLCYHNSCGMHLRRSTTHWSSTSRCISTSGPPLRHRFPILVLGHLGQVSSTYLHWDINHWVPRNFLPNTPHTYFKHIYIYIDQSIPWPEIHCIFKLPIEGRELFYELIWIIIERWHEVSKVRPLLLHYLKRYGEYEILLRSQRSSILLRYHDGWDCDRPTLISNHEELIYVLIVSPILYNHHRGSCLLGVVGLLGERASSAWHKYYHRKFVSRF